ncbi:hypothetical protein PN462_12775 [Spirulina sp. CS-785/01]|uniref:hypothetical protein n=1 Tax=Spirulina sp. CS-785/01 TaxID=3021716 RepID=UPI00232AFE0F|nr:hypothetical protein [Spirulina sp. CS-785/01]MDB9313979.1 hypothetical protein [Spirulina sp. CS-785/01]
MLSFYLLQVHQLIPAPFLSLVVWLSLPLLFWNLGQMLQNGLAYFKRLHQIPCNNCTFFTGDYYLKCTIHPYTACSEQAINCRDFEPNCARNKVALKQD